MPLHIFFQTVKSKLKKDQNWHFSVLAILAIAILAIFLKSQPDGFDAIVHAGAPLDEECLCKIS